jgi:hypothetical protein
LNPLSDDAQDQIDRLLFNLSSFLNGQRHAVSKEPLTMGVAISMGRVLAGNIGATQRMEYTVSVSQSTSPSAWWMGAYLDRIPNGPGGCDLKRRRNGYSDG